MPSPPVIVSTPFKPVSMLATLEPVRVSLKFEPSRCSIPARVSDPSPVAELEAREAWTPAAEPLKEA